MKRYALALPCLFATLVFATISCTESAPTGPDVEIGVDVGLSKKPGRGGGPGGDSGFANWAFVSVKDATLSADVVLSSFDGKVTKSLVRGGSEARFSPRFTEDGSEVVYMRQNELRSVGVDGSSDRFLFDFGTFAAPYYGRFDWIPGGSKIIYNGGGDVAVVDTQTGEPQWLDWPSLVPGTGWMGEVSAGPDLDTRSGFQGPIVLSWGSYNTSDRDLYVVMAREDESGTINLDPYKIAQLALPDDPDGSGQNHPVFSPDGTMIAFQGRAHCCTGHELWNVGFDSLAWSFGAPVLLASPEATPSLERIGYQPAWAPAPDPSWIAYTGYFDGKGPYLTGKLVLVRPDASQTDILPKSAPYFHPDWNPQWDASQ